MARFEVGASRHGLSGAIGGAFENEVADTEEPGDERSRGRSARRERDPHRAHVERVDRQATLHESTCRARHDRHGGEGDGARFDGRVQGPGGGGRENEGIEDRFGLVRDRAPMGFAAEIVQRRPERGPARLDQAHDLELRDFALLVVHDHGPRSGRSLDLQHAPVVSKPRAQLQRELRGSVDHAKAGTTRERMDECEARLQDGRRGPAKHREPIAKRDERPHLSSARGNEP